MVPVHAEVLADDLLAVVLVEGLRGEWERRGRVGGRKGGRINTEKWMAGGVQIGERVL